MINFVILEDNPLHCKKTKEIILTYMMKNDYEFNLLLFEKETDAFIELIESNDSNYIYILDFELPNTTAIDVARRIRKKDWISPIIIFTINGGMAYDTFKQRLQILDFVNKQFEAEKNLHELFDICLEQLKVRKSFKYKIETADYNIDYNKILYIYKDTYKRKSVVVTDKNSYPISLSLKKIKKLLSEDFVFTHKACIVNKSRVDAFLWSKGKVLFDNGTEALYLSKTHKKELIG